MIGQTGRRSARVLARLRRQARPRRVGPPAGPTPSDDGVLVDWRRHALTMTAVALLLTLVAAASWRVSGGRWAIIETASMGRSVTVGSLIVTRPHPVSDLRVGDVVTYRPPTQKRMYTHRVVEVDLDHQVPSVRVKGDANGTADPWAVSQEMLVGKVVAHWAGLGWLVRALPTLILALLVLLAVSRMYVPRGWRSSVRVVGTCVVLGCISLLLRPFVHPVLLNTYVVQDDGVAATRATVVSTGMFPTRVTGSDGDHVDLVSGQIGTVHVDTAADGGPMIINGTAHLTGWWLVGVGLVCLLPLLWTLVVGLAPAPRSVDPRVEQHDRLSGT